jgi:spermidine/putrescine transport system ATP-binding protein
MFVETDKGYELMLQDYNAFEVDSTVGMFIKPSDIHVMHKERTCNTFEGKMIAPNKVEIMGAEFECIDCGLKEGDNIYAAINFDRVELLDNKEDGTVMGEVVFILYKGNHYHITVLTDDGEKIYVDTNDIWDKGDIVGISIAASDLHITKRV